MGRWQELAAFGAACPSESDLELFVPLVVVAPLAVPDATGASQAPAVPSSRGPAGRAPLARSGSGMFVAPVTRRNLTPAPPVAAGDMHGTRRSSGARLEASERAKITGGGVETIGWTLNVSRGGVRLIVEDPLQIGGEYEIQVGDETAPVRPARVVWVQDEADGQIVGAQFLDGSGSEIPPPNR